MRRRWTTGAALLALAACGRGNEAANRQAAAGQAQPAANIIVTTPEGSAVVRAGGGPGALAEGIPAYPGASASGSVDVSGASAQGEGHVVAFSTPDAPAQVIAFYAQAASGAGYRIAQQMTMGPTAMLTAQKGEGDGVTITATRAGGATQVQVVVGRSRH